MRGNRRLAATIVVSAALHAWMLALLVEPPPAPSKERVLDVVLEPQTPAPVEQVVATEPELEPEAEAVVEEPEPVPEEALVAETPLEPETEELIEVPLVPERTVLNLERPTNWDELIDRIPDPDVKLDFNQDLEERVVVAEADRRRKQLVRDRVAAVYGVPDEEYTRIGPRGDEIKINGACYVLVEAPAVEDGTRWWRGPCTDTKTPPFLLDPIDYDALGRVVAD